MRAESCLEQVLVDVDGRTKTNWDDMHDAILKGLVAVADCNINKISDRRIGCQAMLFCCKRA